MEFIPLLQSKLKQLSDSERAQQMSAYMRGQFDFYGVMATPRKNALREVYKEVGVPEQGMAVARALFVLRQRELNHCGQELLFRIRKQWTSKCMKDFEWFITTRSWWDTVDFIASNVVGEYLRRYPTEQSYQTIESWAKSDNMWLQRTAIIYQLKYRELTDTTWLSKVISMHAHQKEFFIKKAIGWALREYSKTNPEWVRKFVGAHILQALSVKEATRLLK